MFEVLQMSFLSVLLASLRLQSELSGAGEAQFEILSSQACGE